MPWPGPAAASSDFRPSIQRCNRPSVGQQEASGIVNPSAIWCNLYWEQTTAGDVERDAATEYDSSTVNVHPPSERRRTASGGGGAGGEGLATAGCGGVNGGKRSWTAPNFANVTYGSGSGGANYIVQCSSILVPLQIARCQGS